MLPPKKPGVSGRTQGVDLVVHGVLDRVDDLDGVERKLRAAAADGRGGSGRSYAISTTATAPAVVAGLALAAERRDARSGARPEAVRERHAEELHSTVAGVAMRWSPSLPPPKSRVGQRQDAVDLHLRNLREEAPQSRRSGCRSDRFLNSSAPSMTVVSPRRLHRFRARSAPCSAGGAGSGTRAQCRRTSCSRKRG